MGGKLAFHVQPLNVELFFPELVTWSVFNFQYGNAHASPGSGLHIINKNARLTNSDDEMREVCV